MRHTYRVGRCALTDRRRAGPGRLSRWQRPYGHLVSARHARRPAFNVCRPPAGGRRRDSAFTLVELLVVVGIIALLVTILMPSLTRALELARRAVCASNLNSIGRGLSLYDAEHKAYPYVPLNGGGWGVAIGTNRDVAPADGQATDRSASSCLYVLVRQGHATKGLFVCPSSGEDAKATGDVAEFWDFEDGTKISYSLMNPYGSQSLFGPTGGGNRPLLADASPYFDPATGLRNEVSAVNLAAAGDRRKVEEGNSPNHGREGQNVTMMGGSTHWKRTADVGPDQDNIFTRSDKPDAADRQGSLPQAGADGSGADQGPAGEWDIWLIP